MEDILASTPVTAEERKDFDGFYASEVVSGARANLEREGRGEGRLYAEVLTLHYDRGLTQAEVAKVLGRSRVAINSLLHRARRALARHLDELLGLVAATEDEVRKERKHLLAIVGRRKARR